MWQFQATYSCPDDAAKKKVMINVYHSQSKTDGSHVLPPGCPGPQAQRKLDQDHKSSCYTKKNRESAKDISNLIISHFDPTVQIQREKNLRIGLKVSIVDRLNQLLSDFDNFLFASYNTTSQNIINYTNRCKNG